MIKRIVTGFCLIVAALQVSAQQHTQGGRPYTYSDEAPATGFSKENLFLGGSLALGFGSYNFNIGANPEIGYSLTNWLDAGVVLNINYNSTRADPYYTNNVRYRAFNYGGGVFARAYPLPFLFLAVQPEYNWIDYNLKNMNNNASASYNTNAGSLLLGAGYGQRIVGQSSFFFSIMFDVLNSQYSPYRDYNGTVLPVIRAGFDVYLHKR